MATLLSVSNRCITRKARLEPKTNVHLVRDFGADEAYIIIRSIMQT